MKFCVCLNEIFNEAIVFDRLWTWGLYRVIIEFLFETLSSPQFRNTRGAYRGSARLFVSIVYFITVLKEFKYFHSLMDKPTFRESFSSRATATFPLDILIHKNPHKKTASSATQFHESDNIKPSSNKAHNSFDFTPLSTRQIDHSKIFIKGHKKKPPSRRPYHKPHQNISTQHPSSYRLITRMCRYWMQASQRNMYPLNSFFCMITDIHNDASSIHFVSIMLCTVIGWKGKEQHFMQHRVGIVNEYIASMIMA